MRLMLIASSFLLIVQTVAAAPRQDHDPPPWAWSMEDRLEHRANAEKRRGRLLAAYGSDAPTTVLDVLDGNRDPHLFLPDELLRSFLRRAFNPDIIVADAIRLQYAPALRESAMQDYFWTEMEVLAGAYVDTQEVIWALTQQLASAQHFNERTDLLRRRRVLETRQHEELENVLSGAYARFGIERFNKFLYLAIPPGLTITFTKAPGPHT